MVITVGALMFTFFSPFAIGNAAPAPAFSATKVVQRVHLINGADQVVDTRTVHVTVSQTTNLRDRQGITVTWSGAHPTWCFTSLASAFRLMPRSRRQAPTTSTYSAPFVFLARSNAALRPAS